MFKMQKIPLFCTFLNKDIIYRSPPAVDMSRVGRTIYIQAPLYKLVGRYKWSHIGPHCHLCALQVVFILKKKVVVLEGKCQQHRDKSSIPWVISRAGEDL